MLDWSLLFQVKELLADSLLKAGQGTNSGQLVYVAFWVINLRNLEHFL